MLEVISLKKSYGGTEILRGVNATFERGKLALIFGKSGVGKTTLLFAIGGMLRPDGGKIIFMGKDIYGDPDSYRKRYVGFVFQRPRFFPGLNALENICAFLSLSMPWSEALARARESLQELGVAHLMKRRISTLSGGEAQLIELARAFAKRPDVLLLDEPTGNLDVGSSLRVYSAVRDFVKRHNAVGIMVSHDVNAKAFADEIFMLIDGVLVRERGNPDEGPEAQKAFESEIEQAQGAGS